MRDSLFPDDTSRLAEGRETPSSYQQRMRSSFPWHYECGCGHEQLYQEYGGEQRGCMRCKGIMKLVKTPEGWYSDEEWAKRLLIPMLHSAKVYLEHGGLMNGFRILAEIQEKVVERLVDENRRTVDRSGGDSGTGRPDDVRG